MTRFGRREFLERSAIFSAAAGLTVWPAATEATAAKARGSAADRLRVAVVGVNNRSRNHINAYLGKNNCEIVAVCDCDEAVIGKAMTAITDGQGEAPKYVKDFRRLLDDKSIEVVSIATPNHWHALITKWAMRAGKDVYCEKPATHNVREGRLMADAAAKYGCVCQVGTQSRSTTGMRAAMAYLHDGKLGKVDLAYGVCYKRRQRIGKVSAPTAPPATMDYGLWSGPAAVLPVRRKRLHYDWHWQWEYGNGDLGNQGVHEVDEARWGLNKLGLPNTVTTFGGRFGYADDGETPNTELSVFDYGDAHLVFEVRGLASGNPYPRGVEKNRPAGENFMGNVWYVTEGTMVATSNTDALVLDRDSKKVAQFHGGSEQQHFDNFVAAVRSRKAADLHCPVEEGHVSAALCPLGRVDESGVHPDP